MENQFNKSGQLHISFNSLNTVPNDPTIMKGQVIIFDFEKSGNNQIITKDVAEENIQTLVGKRICCKYINKSENDGIDALGTHEEYETTDRNGNDVVYTDTNAIGYIENVYIGEYTGKDGVTKEVVYGDVILWCDDHYADIIGLIKEWLERDIPVHLSVEYLYFNYSVKNGVEYILSPILFTAHTVLNSEDRGNSIEILPAYDCATLTSLNELKEQWNKAINSINKKNDNSLKSSNNELDSNKLNNIQKEENKDMENKFIKALNELSIGDLRFSIITALGDVMTGNEYENMWISNYGIFSESKYFIYETYEDSKWVNYKVTYTLGENDAIILDYANKEKVEGQYTYVSVNELQDLEASKNAKVELEQSKNELDTANAKIEELNGEIKSLNEKAVEKSNNSKVDTDKFNELTNKLVSLNSLVAEMQPIVEKYNAEVFEKSFNEAKESYKVKFTSVNALDVFEEESTQELIKESINQNKEKANEAIFNLNSLIVNSIKPVEEKVDTDDILSNTPKISINQIVKAEDTENLTDVEDDVLSEYGFNY